MSISILKNRFPNAVVKRVLFKEYQYKLIMDQLTYHIKVLPVSSNTILTINSKHIWNIKRGRADGVSFKTGSSTLIYLNEFNKLPNKIIVFKSKPYKLLKHLNESDIVDVSSSALIGDIKIFWNMKDIKL